MKGRMTVAAMLILGIIFGGYAWWHRLRQGERVLHHWGDAAIIVRHAPSAELLLFGSLSDSDDPSINAVTETVVAQQAVLPVSRRINLSSTPGFVHARHALIEDTSYDWDRPNPLDQRQWTFALQFHDEQRAATVLFDLDDRIAMLLETNAELSLKPEMAVAFHKKLADWTRSTTPIASRQQTPPP